MKDNKLCFNTPDEVETVYYEAFRHCDSEVMAALWADGDVLCVHPGSGPIVGHTAVARSWSHIFDNAEPSDIEFNVAKRSTADDLAVHVVTEHIGDKSGQNARLLATNVYQKFDQGWLMIEHHASIIQTGADQHTLQ